MRGLRHFRAWPRRPVDTAVALRIGRGSDGDPRRGVEVRARLLDVSLGGAGIVLDAPLVVGAQVELVLHAPHRWDPLVLPASIAWTKGPRAGLAFRPADDRDAYALFEMLGTQVFER